MTVKTPEMSLVYMPSLQCGKYSHYCFFTPYKTSHSHVLHGLAQNRLNALFKMILDALQSVSGMIFY